MSTKILLGSALIVLAIFLSSALNKSYNDLKEVRQIQEHLQIISDIKILLAKQYNKTPQEITRDEIIAYLPSSGNWEKILLLDRNNSSNINNRAFIDENANIQISEDEKLKLLALRGKLRSSLLSNSNTSEGNISFDIARNYTVKQKDKDIEDSLDKIVFYFIQKLIYESSSVSKTEISNSIDSFIPMNSIYQELSDIGENENTIEEKKKIFFRSLLKTRLENSKNAQENKLYVLLRESL